MFEALMRGTLGYIRNRKTEEKKNHPKPQKNSTKTENRTQNRQKTATMVTSGAYTANYTNTYFIKVFVNVMELSKAFISFSICWNHRFYFCRSLEPGLSGFIFRKAAGNGTKLT